MVFFLLKDHFPALASTTILRNHDAKYNSNLRHPLRRESQLPTYTIHHHAQDVMPTLLLENATRISPAVLPTFDTVFHIQSVLLQFLRFDISPLKFVNLLYNLKLATLIRIYPTTIRIITSPLAKWKRGQIKGD